MTIKHIVISGGGPIMIEILSSIQELENKKYLNINEIESIYGTSAGAIIGLMISLKFDWETLNNYIIKRPWQEVFFIKIQNILDSYTKKGIFDIKTVEKCFKPLFDAKNIKIDINMEELYNLTKIELHMFSFEINNFKIEDISYKTYPKLPVLTAIQMTCAIPVLLTPVFIENKCFMDGGIACNYPLNYCIESGKCISEILGFKNKYSENITTINTDSSLLDYILNFLFKTIFNLNLNSLQPTIENELIIEASYLTIDTMRSALTNIDVRKNLFEKGKQSATNFLEKLQNII